MKKTLKYSSITAAIAALSPLNTEAKVIYNDIDDVIISSGTNYTLDLDGDGINDFTFNNWYNPLAFGYTTTTSSGGT